MRLMNGKCFFERKEVVKISVLGDVGYVSSLLMRW